MKIIASILSFIYSVISLILSIIAFTMDTGYYEAASYYGGDAYTGIQQAAAQGANNTMYLAEVCAFGFGAMLLISAFAFFLFGIYNILNIKKADLKTATDKVNSAINSVSRQGMAQPPVQNPPMNGFPGMNNYAPVNNNLTAPKTTPINNVPDTAPVNNNVPDTAPANNNVPDTVPVKNNPAVSSVPAQNPSAQNSPSWL